MIFFKSSLINLSSKKYLVNSERFLKIFKEPTPELAVGNFTAIFAIIAALKQHGTFQHPNLKVICPPFWLDAVSPRYGEENWGQTKEGLPKIARDMLEDIYPGLSSEQLLSWRQIQELRMTSLYALENIYKVPVLRGEPMIKKLNNGQFDITVTHGHQKTSWITEKNTHFYLWYKEPKKFSIQGAIQRSSTEIYQYPPGALPSDMDIIVLGDGLSVIWLAKHFATLGSTRRIICIKYPHAQLNKDVPSNSGVDYNRIITIDSDKAQLSISNEDPHLAMVYSPERQETYRGLFFTAIGVETPKNLIDAIPQEQLTSPDQWLASRWIAPKNIPIGSLMESIARWFAITENLKWGFEPQAYHDAKKFFNEVIEENCSPTLNLDIRYVDALGNTIMGFDNPLPEEKLRTFLLEIYKEVYSPTDDQISLFDKEINIFLDKRVNLLEREKFNSEFTT